MADLIAPPGYESDTGERDNPTYENFRTNTPVTRTIELNARSKVLNREGRAICRIAHAHGWSFSQIAQIFGVSDTSVSRAVQNVRYNPRDRISEDYARLKDPDLAQLFPRGELIDDADSTYIEPQSETRAVDRSSRTLAKRCHVDLNRGGNISSTSTAKKPRRNEDIPDLQFRNRSNPSVFRGLPGLQTADTSVSSASRNPGSAHVSAPRRPPPPGSAPPQQTLSSFLRDVLTMDLSTHRAFLQAQGFSMLRLQVMAGSWPHTTIAEALERTLMGSKVVGAGRNTLTALEVITLELGIRKLKPKLPAGSTPRPLTSPLPGPSSNSSTSATPLLSFLHNVMGFDLTEHHALLKDQGFDVAFLRGMTTWHTTDLQEALRRLLTGKVHVGRGMSALDILALEFALREIGRDRLLD